MAIKLADKPQVNPADADFPYGSIKDDTGLNDGTPVNQVVYDDIHQFFERLRDQAGIVANGLLDNETNTYQNFVAFLRYIRFQASSAIAISSNVITLPNDVYGNVYTITGTGDFYRMTTMPNGSIVTLRKTDSGTMKITDGSGSGFGTSLVRRAKTSDPDIIIEQFDTVVLEMISGSWIVVATTARRVRSYTALLSQSGTSAPTSTIVQDDYSNSFTLARVNQGVYSISSSGVFLSGKVWGIVGLGPNNIAKITIERNSNTVMTIRTYDPTNNPADSILDSTPVKIEVYP